MQKNRVGGRRRELWRWGADHNGRTLAVVVGVSRRFADHRRRLLAVVVGVSRRFADHMRRLLAFVVGI